MTPTELYKKLEKFRNDLADLQAQVDHDAGEMEGETAHQLDDASSELSRAIYALEDAMGCL